MIITVLNHIFKVRIYIQLIYYKYVIMKIYIKHIQTCLIFVSVLQPPGAIHISCASVSPTGISFRGLLSVGVVSLSVLG